MKKKKKMELVFSRVYIYNGVERGATEGVGYKIMNPYWQARLGRFVYEVGKTYSMDENALHLCKSGFHYCEHAIDCLQHYDFIPENKYSQVKIHGKVVRVPEDELATQNKCATNKIEICSEINFEQWLELCTVTVIVLCNGRKYQDEIYVKGILEKRVRYVHDVSEQKEDMVVYKYIRIRDLVYAREEYRKDGTTLLRTITWNDKSVMYDVVDYDSNGDLPIGRHSC
jgi:hypothetical protein